MVNGLGYSSDQVGDWLDEHYLNSAIAPDLYDFVINDPGVILPYGIGLLKFEQMKSYAENSLGDGFHLKDFNEVLLTYGDRMFEDVMVDVKEYAGENTSIIQEPSEPVSHPTVIDSKESDTSIYLYIGAGVGIVAVILIAIMAAKKNKKNNPYA